MKTSDQIAAELEKLNALLVKYPNVQSPPMIGQPGYVEPLSKPVVSTATIKGAIQGLSPDESFFDIAMSDPNTGDEACNVGGKSMSFMWSHDIHSWSDFWSPNLVNGPAPLAPSDIIANQILKQ